MIIDFHTHTFPEALAEHAISRLAKSARAKNYLNGTVEALCASMKETGIDYSVLLPVVTRPKQQATVNRIAAAINENYKEKGLISFGGIHPDNEDYRRILRELAGEGIKGIKLHPVFQETNIDDIRYLRIIECACENDLIVLVHAGFDISYPGAEHASVRRIVSVLDTLQPDKFVLAHMGGWGCWNETEEDIIGRKVYMDTSFSLLPIAPASGTTRNPQENPPLSKERFLRMVRKHGADRILFGTDSPWSGQKEVLAFLKESGLTGSDLSCILGNNACKLLQL
ncbi:MAG: amidohydrolase family protein [Lachnospiraceae bacterium]|nr:amidohydrolase family protein [Lachnospiraceae bacterium]